MKAVVIRAVHVNPEDGQDIRPKHAEALYTNYQIIVQLAGGEICVYYTAIQKMYDIKYTTPNKHSCV
jgi:hypothetical protein